MDEYTAKESIGSRVIAEDAYWGTYLGELDSVFDTPVRLGARVKIIEVLVMPKQHAILFKDKPYYRDPYRIGSIHNFDVENVNLYQAAEQLAS